MERCSARHPDPNARFHNMIEVKCTYDRVEGLRQEYACQDCGITIETKDKNVVVTGG